MRRFSLPRLVILLLLPAAAWGWGDEGHQIVIEAAIRLLPEPARSFYGAQLPFLLAHGSDPDDWSVIDPDEARRHYIDLELLGEEPLADLPATYEEAVARFGPETLREAGTLPWTIVRFSQRLAQAMREEDWERSALLAAALSHYTADACMPLHTTVNYKGQLTDNLILDDRTEHRHVHVRFEVAMLRQFRGEIKGRVVSRLAVARLRAEALRRAKARPVGDPLALVCELLAESHSRIAPILRADRDLTAELGLDGADPDRIRFTQDYYAGLYERTGDVAAEQLARAARATASLWLWAWKEAGSPEVPSERVAFGEQAVMVERGMGEPRRTVTKIFRHNGSAYALVTADWPKAGRFSAGRRLTDEEYRAFWRELEGADVFSLPDALTPTEPPGPTLTVTVARRGRQRRFSVYGPEHQQDTRYGRIYRAVRAVAPGTPGPVKMEPKPGSPGGKRSP